MFALADELGVALETAAQRYSRLLVHKLAQPVDPSSADYQRVDINRVDAVESRSIGAETLALHAIDQLQLAQKLTALGFNGVDQAAALGSIIGRMVSLAANCIPMNGCNPATHWATCWIMTLAAAPACPGFTGSAINCSNTRPHWKTFWRIRSKAYLL